MACKGTFLAMGQGRKEAFTAPQLRFKRLRKMRVAASFTDSCKVKLKSNICSKHALLNRILTCHIYRYTNSSPGQSTALKVEVR